jgi:ribonuclease III
MTRSNLAQFQEATGLTFADQSVLLRALTHPSYLNEHPKEGLQDNQRLEFLGDAVLDFISGEYLFQRFPEASEGQLTRLRAALVRTETLAEFALACGVGISLLLGRGEEESGGRERDANLCDAYEAVVGALYLDQGLDVVRNFVYPRFQVALEDILSMERDKDPKSRLQEWAQRNLGATPTYETIRTTGPDHAKEFTVVVYIGGKPYAEGTGARKQLAAQIAAQLALDLLRTKSKP